METEILIQNGKAVLAGSVLEAWIAVDRGRITAIGVGDEKPAARKVIDAKGNYVLPGVIDEHVHIMDMEMSAFENFTTGTSAAAAGGVTTVCEMPLGMPPVISRKVFDEKRALAEKKALVDFALWGGAVPGNLPEIPDMVKAGAIGFKAMMTGSVPGVFETLDDGLLLDFFRRVAECGSIATVHAENDAIIKNLESRMKSEGRNDIHAFLESRPVVQEVEAISRAAMLAQEARCSLHIVHVSCPQGVDLIAKRKAEGQNISCESGPQYLAFSFEDAKRLGPYLKFAPPVRSKAETEQLWRQLAEGKIDTLGSDHGPHTKESKEKGWTNIWEAGNGALGLETFLPVMLSEGVNRGRISIQKLVSVMCENPARRFGIYPQKGTLQVGSDADLVIVDLKKEYVVDAGQFHSIHKHSPFEGRKLKGAPVLTMVRGEVIAEKGEILGKPGYGRFVRPTA